MAVVKVNMSHKSDRSGAGVPDGTYTCEVVQIVEGESRVSKSPQLNVTMEVVEPEEYAGSTILDFITMSDNAMFRRADFFYACGIDSEDDEDVEIDTDELARQDEEGEEVNEQGALIKVVKRTNKGKGLNGRDQIRIFYNRVEEESGEDSGGDGKVEAEVEEEPKPEKKKAVGKGSRKPVRRAVRR